MQGDTRVSARISYEAMDAAKAYDIVPLHNHPHLPFNDTQDGPGLLLQV